MFSITLGPIGVDAKGKKKARTRVSDQLPSTRRMIQPKKDIHDRLLADTGRRSVGRAGRKKGQEEWYKDKSADAKLPVR